MGKLFAGPRQNPLHRPWLFPTWTSNQRCMCKKMQYRGENLGPSRCKLGSASSQSSFHRPFQTVSTVFITAYLLLHTVSRPIKNQQKVCSQRKQVACLRVCVFHSLLSHEKPYRAGPWSTGKVAQFRNNKPLLMLFNTVCQLLLYV